MSTRPILRNVNRTVDTLDGCKFAGCVAVSLLLLASRLVPLCPRLIFPSSYRELQSSCWSLLLEYAHVTNVSLALCILMLSQLLFKSCREKETLVISGNELINEEKFMSLLYTSIQKKLSYWFDRILIRIPSGSFQYRV